MLESNACVPKESLPRKRRANTTRMALKQRCPQLILQVTDAPAHSRRFNIECGSRLPKAPVFRRRHEVAELTKLKTKVRWHHGTARLPHRSVAKRDHFALLDKLRIWRLRARRKHYEVCEIFRRDFGCLRVLKPKH